MSSINHTKSIPETNSPTEPSYGNNLNPLAKKTERTVSENIERERAAAHGRQFNLLKASEDAAMCSQECQSILNRPSEDKNTEPLNENRVVSETILADLPQDMKMKIRTCLGAPSLKAVMNAPQETHEAMESNTFFQNRTLYDFALETAILLKNDYWKSQVLQHVQAIAVSLAKAGDMASSKTLFHSLREKALLIEDTDMQAQMLQDIALGQFENGDEATVMETVLLTKDPYLKLDAIQNITISIAMNLARNGNIAEAKEIALLTWDVSLKSQVLLQDIAARLAKNGDMADSKMLFNCLKEKALLMENIDIQSQKKALLRRDIRLSPEARLKPQALLQDIAATLAKNGDTAGSKEIFDLVRERALLIMLDLWKSQALHNIVVNLAKNGDIADSKKIIPLIKNNDCKSQAVHDVAVKLAESGDIAGIEEMVILIEKTYTQSCILMEKAYTQSCILQDIATTLAKNGNMARAQEIFDLSKKRASLIRDYDERSQALYNIVVKLTQNGDTEQAVDIVRLMKDGDFKTKAEVSVAISIATSLAKNGDVARSKEAFNLSKETALLIRDTRKKADTLRNIAVVLAKSGDTAGAKEIVLLIEDLLLKFEALRDITKALAENGDITGAKEVIPMIEDDFWKSTALRDITIALAKNGNIEEAKEDIAHMKEMGDFQNAVESTMQLIRIINEEK